MIGGNIRAEPDWLEIFPRRYWEEAIVIRAWTHKDRTGETHVGHCSPLACYPSYYSLLLHLRLQTDEYIFCYFKENKQNKTKKKLISNWTYIYCRTSFLYLPDNYGLWTTPNRGCRCEGEANFVHVDIAGVASRVRDCHTPGRTKLLYHTHVVSARWAYALDSPANLNHCRCRRSVLRRGQSSTKQDVLKQIIF